MYTLVTAGSGFLLSGFLVFLLRPICLRFEHVDEPGGRKRHNLATPLSGGLAIAVSVVLLALLLFPSAEAVGFALGVALLLLIGVRDDHKHVPAWLRLLMQALVVGIGMCLLGDVRLSSLGNLLGQGEIQLGMWSTLFTIFSVVGVINAVNMIDGLDGLAGGFAVLVLGVILCVTGIRTGSGGELPYVVIGSVAGFLMFNLRTPWNRQARAFLGDAGSLVLGYILVWFAIRGTQGSSAIMAPITAVWLFGLPLCDTLYLMAARVLRGKSPLHADCFHLHHFLLRVGLTPGRALCVWLSMAAVFIGVGVGADFGGVSEAVMFAGFVSVFVCYCIVMTVAWRRLARLA